MPKSYLLGLIGFLAASSLLMAKSAISVILSSVHAGAMVFGVCPEIGNLSYSKGLIFEATNCTRFTDYMNQLLESSTGSVFVLLLFACISMGTAMTLYYNRKLLYIDGNVSDNDA